jgi:hypothetical protein
MLLVMSAASLHDVIVAYGAFEAAREIEAEIRAWIVAVVSSKANDAERHRSSSDSPCEDGASTRVVSGFFGNA